MPSQMDTPILLVHGYSSEGKKNTAEDIYGSLPKLLKKHYKVVDLNLSRWISLNDGITLDDVSFAMERALRESYPELLEKGFHVIIHSTGALVVRNWIRLFSRKGQCPIKNFIHLAGANFGSGLAHIGQGQLARWKNSFQGTDRGMKILNELEFGSWKTLDMHIDFLSEGNDIYSDYEVQEFCLIGSQTLPNLRYVPIRYVKEDSSDNTIRTSAGNLNFNYVQITPKSKARNMHVDTLDNEIEKRLTEKKVDRTLYDIELNMAEDRTQIPYAILFETAHFGDKIGIVQGKSNRKEVIPLIRKALDTPYDRQAYAKVASEFEAVRKNTFERAAKLDNNWKEWDKKSQYEGHAMVIFRIRDQFGNGVRHFDINFNSDDSRANREKYTERLEKLIEDHHGNKKHRGTITFYFRTQEFKRKRWQDKLKKAFPVDFEITAHEDDSDDVRYVPLRISLSNEVLQAVVQTFKTTVIDVTLQRLPSKRVFEIVKPQND